MISVCIATYNGEKYIKKQISSILSQLSDSDEVIVSDDGSLDSTIDIVRSIKDDRIKIYIHEKKVAYCSCKAHRLTTFNFENALRYARGNFIFLADQDDIWENNKVEICLKALESYDLIMTNYSIIDENDHLIMASYYEAKPISSLLINVVKMPFHGCCMAFKKQLLSKALPFPKELILHDNWIGFIALLNKYKVGYIDIPVLKYRRHFNNVSALKGKSDNSILFRIIYRVKFCFQLFKRIVLF